MLYYVILKFHLYPLSLPWLKAQSAAGWRQKVAFLNQFWQLLRTSPSGMRQRVQELVVSKNGTPKLMAYHGKSYQNG